MPLHAGSLGILPLTTHWGLYKLYKNFHQFALDSLGDKNSFIYIVGHKKCFLLDKK